MRCISINKQKNSRLAVYLSRDAKRNDNKQIDSFPFYTNILMLIYRVVRLEQKEKNAAIILPNTYMQMWGIFLFSWKTWWWRQRNRETGAQPMKYSMRTLPILIFKKKCISDQLFVSSFVNQGLSLFLCLKKSRSNFLIIWIFGLFVASPKRTTESFNFWIEMMEQPLVPIFTSILSSR